ncbi:MAG: tetratricopeptide repeat protein [Ruminococcaceae bacterium]|nr:tetratricopeptide repeat protein [Oscillospiraceae bacterium]
MKKRKIVIGVCFFVLLALTIAIPIIDYNMKGKITNETILKSFVLLIGDFLFLIRNVVSYSAADKKSFAIYESEYEHIIGKAFKQPENKRERTKLLKAIHLYNQNKFNKSIERLEALLPKCQLSSDRYAVLSFIALCYTDMGAYKKSIEYYEKILSYDNSKSDAWSNLGYVYKKIGDFNNQTQCFLKAIENDPNNAYANNNLAQALFSAGYYEDAIPYAEKALEIKADLHPASSCLAMCYCALGDEEQCSHYSKIAISNGSNSYGLNTILSNLRIARNNEINNEDNNNE